MAQTPSSVVEKWTPTCLGHDGVCAIYSDATVLSMQVDVPKSHGWPRVCDRFRPFEWLL